MGPKNGEMGPKNGEMGPKNGEMGPKNGKYRIIPFNWFVWYSETIMVEENRMIRKHNQLINARYAFSVAETRLVLKLLSLIEKGDESFKVYSIDISDFDDITKHKGMNEYDRVKTIIEGLQKRIIHIPTEDGFIQSGWIGGVKYIQEKGEIYVSVFDELKPYLLQLKEQFTRYQLKHVLLLRSFHSFRIYELLKQYEKIGQRVFSVDELKNILRIEDKYKRYNDFKKDVLIKAQEDLKKHTDIRFEFFEKKKGRKINQITFFIARNVPDEELSLESDEEVDKILSLLNNQLSDDKQVSKSVLVQIIEKHPKSYDEIEKIIKNITFKDSFSVVETLVAAFKGFVA